MECFFSWYAVYVASRAEKKVKERLDQIGVENYLPLKTEVRIWNDRRKKMAIPLITGYIFVRVEERQFIGVLETSGVVTFLKEKGRAVRIPDRQIEQLRLMVEHAGDQVEFSEINMKRGDKVLVKQGELTGLIGELIENRGKYKIAIRLEYFGCALTTIPLSFVEKISCE